MKHVILVLFICLTLFCCQKKETVLETEKDALNSVFNNAVDSIYLKIKEKRNIEKSVKKKTIVIYDSLISEMPSHSEFKARFSTVKNSYYDTISEKVTPKIELSELQKTSDFKYAFKLSISKDTIAKNFWNSKHALHGILLFSKIRFDKERKFGAFRCTYIKRDMENVKYKYFSIYIEKEHKKWKLREVKLWNVLR